METENGSWTLLRASLMSHSTHLTRSEGMPVDVGDNELRCAWSAYWLSSVFALAGWV